MEVIFQDSIGFIYDVCRVIICKSNKRESWINAFLCDGSEEEDMLYIDNLLKKFQGIEISNKLLGYKKSQTQDAILEDLYGKYLQEKLEEADFRSFLNYITNCDILKKAVAEYYFDLKTIDCEEILNAIFNSKYGLDLKAELYNFFLFTEKQIELLKTELTQIFEVLVKNYTENAETAVDILKRDFNIVQFLNQVGVYVKSDIWEIGITKYYISFSILNRYLVIKQNDMDSNGVLILGIEYEHSFMKKENFLMDLVSFGNALGDKIRMKMITLLEEHGELTLTDFSNKLDIVNAVALYHLDILKNSNLILRRNEGRRVLYWLNSNQFSKAIEEIHKIIRRCD